MRQDAQAKGYVAAADPLAFLAGGGEMGERMRALDWSRTPLGPPENWPQSLRTVVRILLTSRFAMWMAWGPELTFLCNDAYLPTVGIKRDWVLGARSDEVWSEIWPDIGPRIQQVLETGEATWDEALLLYLGRSGFTEETYHTFSYSPLSDDASRVVGMLCVVTEVTERVIGERQLGMMRDLGARLSAAATRDDVMSALEACLAGEPRDLPFAMAYLSSEDRTIAQRAALHGLCDRAPAAPETIRLGGDETGPWPLASVLASGQPALVDLQSEISEGLELRYWQSPPRQAMILPVADVEGGEPLGFLVAGLNPHRAVDASYMGFVALVTGQVAAAIARADAYDRERARAEALAALDRAKTTFFSNISHEFRTPLTLMLGPLEEILERQAASTGDRALVDVAHRNGLRLLRLVNALLDFSRIESGRVQASFVGTDLSGFTRDLASTFRSVCERAGLSLSLECPPLSRPVYIDREMWERIVLNLVSNAFKFTLEGGIEISVTETANAARLTIRDTGVGIPDHELPRLFERFHRVEGTRGRSFEGSGIGLALVYDLVRLHGGSIAARSAEGRGTTFTVEVPFGTEHLPQDRVSAAPGETGAASRADAFTAEASRWLSSGDVIASEEIIHDAGDDLGAGAETHAGRVVLADDNADLRDYVGRLLKAKGYEVEVVADGYAALDLVRERRPDLVLTDIMMPRLDGFGLLAAIRSDQELADIPVIMLSARAGEEAQVEGLDAGADDYLAKPFSARELLARVSANLELARVRRDAAEAVRVSAAELRRISDAVPAFVYRADAKGRILSVSGRWTEYTGQPVEEALNGGWAAAVHPDDQQRLADGFLAAQRDRTTYSAEFRCRRKDGEYRWFYTVSEPELDANGDLLGWFGTSTDVHDRHLAGVEKSRRERRDSFLLRLEDRLRPLSDADQIKAAAAESLGVELAASRVCYVDVDEEAGTASVVLSYTSPGIPDAVGEYRLDRLAGSIDIMRSGRPLVVNDLAADPRTASLAALPEISSARVVAVLDVPLIKNGVLVGTLSVNHHEPRDWTADEVDLTLAVAERTWAAVERARAERQLQKLNAELAVRIEGALREREAALAQLHEAQKLETLGQLTGGVAHDFNNLLTPIVGALDLLRRRYALDARATRMLDGAQQSAERARVLVNRLLTFARRQHLDPQPTNLSDLVLGLIDLVEQSVGSQVVVRVDAPEVGNVLADANQLELAILNLCVNARDAMPGGGEVTLSTGEVEIAGHHVLPPGRYVRLSVGDTGVGMDAATLRRAVEPFYTTKGVGKGTGLGLSMVHGLAAQSGGTLTLESAPGGGTTASIVLPMVGPRPGKRPGGISRQPVVAGESRRILLVDDEELVRTSTADMLGALGHEVEEASSGHAALAVLRRNGEFDLIVTDQMMPGMTGLDLIAEARKLRPGIAVLVITGYASFDNDEGDAYARLGKPFGVAELAAAVASAGQGAC